MNLQHQTIEGHANNVPIFSSRVIQNELRVDYKNQSLNSV